MLNKPKADKLLREAEERELTKEELSELYKFSKNISGWAFDTSYLSRFVELGLQVPDDADSLSNVDEYTDAINTFPPNLERIAGLFFRKFMIPVEAIPTQTKSGRSQFSEWIIQFEHLDRVGGIHSKEAMDKTFKMYQTANFPVARPAAINSYFVSAVAEIRREQSKQKNLAGKNSDTLTDRESVSDIGSMFDEE